MEPRVLAEFVGLRAVVEREEVLDLLLVLDHRKVELLVHDLVLR